MIKVNSYVYITNLYSGYVCCEMLQQKCMFLSKCGFAAWVLHTLFLSISKHMIFNIQIDLSNIIYMNCNRTNNKLTTQYRGTTNTVYDQIVFFVPQTKLNKNKLYKTFIVFYNKLIKTTSQFRNNKILLSLQNK